MKDRPYERWSYLIPNVSVPMSQALSGTDAGREPTAGDMLIASSDVTYKTQSQNQSDEVQEHEWGEKGGVGWVGDESQKILHYYVDHHCA